MRSFSELAILVKATVEVVEACGMEDLVVEAPVVVLVLDSAAVVEELKLMLLCHPKMHQLRRLGWHRQKLQAGNQVVGIVLCLCKTISSLDSQTQVRSWIQVRTDTSSTTSPFSHPSLHSIHLL
jgi:hypothetical protein